MAGALCVLLALFYRSCVLILTAAARRLLDQYGAMVIRPYLKLATWIVRKIDSLQHVSVTVSTTSPNCGPVTNGSTQSAGKLSRAPGSTASASARVGISDSQASLPSGAEVATSSPDGPGSMRAGADQDVSGLKSGLSQLRAAAEDVPVGRSAQAASHVSAEPQEQDWDPAHGPD